MYIIHGVSYTESSIHISIKRVEKSTSFPWIFPGWERGCRKVIDFALLCRTTGLKKTRASFHHHRSLTFSGVLRRLHVLQVLIGSLHRLYPL